MVGVLRKDEVYVATPGAGLLQPPAVGLPIDLDILLPNDNQNGRRHLREPGGCVCRPQLTGEGLVGRGGQALQQHLNALRQ